MTGADLALLTAIAILVVLIAALTVSQTAIGQVTRTRAQAFAASGRRGAVALADLLHRPDDVHTPLALASLLCLLVEATLVGVVADRLLGPAGVVGATVANLATVFVVAIAAPRTWAMIHPARAGGLVARPVRALVCRRPVQTGVQSLVRLVNLVVPGEGLQAGPYARPDPRSDADATALGIVAYDQRELVESIAEFADTVTREVMTPRPDMVVVTTSFRVGDAIEVCLINGYTRLPVCSDGIDDIAGLVYAQDLLRAARDGREGQTVGELLRTASFVPETKRLPELLRQMQRQQLHMAVVVDEYGGTAGLVTLEDIVEELVGDIVDEFDVADELIETLPSGDLLVRGRAPLDEVSQELGTGLPEGEWDTVGGLVSSRLGRLPVAGDAVSVGGFRLTVERIQGRRIGWVRVSRLRPGDMGAARQPRAAGSDDRTEDGPGRRERNDRGVIGGAEALPFGLLVFVTGTLLAGQIWAVVDAKLAVDAAAREATRTYVEAGAGDAAAAEQVAREAGRAALEAHGRDGTRGKVRLARLAPPAGAPAASGGFVRCAEVTFTATYPVATVDLPGVGGLGPVVETRASHSELIDPFRDGVPGDVDGC